MMLLGFLQGSHQSCGSPKFPYIPCVSGPQKRRDAKKLRNPTRISRNPCFCRVSCRFPTTLLANLRGFLRLPACLTLGKGCLNAFSASQQPTDTQGIPGTQKKLWEPARTPPKNFSKHMRKQMETASAHRLSSWKARLETQTAATNLHKREEAENPQETLGNPRKPMGNPQV